MNTIDWVLRYLAEKWSVIPIPSRSKAPEIKDWPTRAFFDSDFAHDSNIGVRLGEPSRGLVDIDLDCIEAVKAAPTLLPPTARRHGRPGVGVSHYWYIAQGAKSERWLDTDGKVIIELRSTGGQTLVPGSIHPSGEQLYWEKDQAPATVLADELHASARNTATAALLGRVWPRGNRHVCARDLAGFLAARGLAAKDVESIVRTAAAIANDEEIEDRARVARDTVMTFGTGGKTTGAPALKASVGQEVVALLIRWFGNDTDMFDRVVDEMNQSRFGARVGKDYVYGLETETGVVFQPARALFEEFANQRVKIGTKKVKSKDDAGQVTESDAPIYRTKFEIWREHPKKRSYRTVGFWPPPLHAPERDFNLWKGFAVTPLFPDDEALRSSREDLRIWVEEHARVKCEKYLDLTRDIICSGNHEHYEYLLKWMAFTVQQPGIPIEVSVAMLGELGTGKGTFARNFGALFGRHYTHLDRTEQLAGKFNSAISGKVLVFADEAFFAGDKKDLGSLKRLITEPTLSIERKGIDVVEENNCVHLIMATNNEHVHQAGRKERRFFTTLVSDVRMQDHAYFNAINQEMRNGGREALLSYLLTREVEHDDVRRVVRTDELANQQEQSMSPELRWWKERLYLGEIDHAGWPDCVNVETVLYKNYLSWCDDQRVNRRVTLIELSRKILKPWLGNPKTATSGPLRGRSTRSLQQLAVARKTFDQLQGTATRWDDNSFELETQ